MYQVTGHGAHATVMSPRGPITQFFLKGQILPETATDAEIRHLLSVGLITPIAAAAAGPIPTAPTTTPADTGGEGDGDSGGEGGPQVDPEVEAKRAAARDKLPTDGSAPDGRASQPVLVEWLVGKGHRYEDLAKAEKADLVELMKQYK